MWNNWWKVEILHRSFHFSWTITIGYTVQCLGELPENQLSAEVSQIGDNQVWNSEYCRDRNLLCRQVKRRWPLSHFVVSANSGSATETEKAVLLWRMRAENRMKLISNCVDIIFPFHSQSFASSLKIEFCQQKLFSSLYYFACPILDWKKAIGIIGNRYFN